MEMWENRRSWICVPAAQVVLLAYCTFQFPEALSKILLLSYSQAARAFLAVGFINILLLIRSMTLLQARISPWIAAAIAVTGRKRRCGWIDLVALKYAIMVDGVTKLIMMKSDVLDSFETIKACVAYKMDGEEIDYFPFDINETIEPVYVELPGWQTDMTKMQSEDEFPEEFNAYLSFLEEQLGVPIKIVSLGPDREQTIERYTEE